jgi:hypothetical protein
VKWEHKLDTELDGSMLFNDIYRITNDTKLRNTEGISFIRISLSSSSVPSSSTSIGVSGLSSSPGIDVFILLCQGLEIVVISVLEILIKLIPSVEKTMKNHGQLETWIQFNQLLSTQSFPETTFDN